MKKKLFYTISVFPPLLFVFCIIYLSNFSVNGLKKIGYEVLRETTRAKLGRTSRLLLYLGAPASPSNEYMEVDSLNYWLEQNPPLYFAVKNNDIELAAALIQHDADVNWCCCACSTFLHQAIISKNEKMVNLLLNSGADPGRDYNMEATTEELARQRSTENIVNIIKSYNAAVNYPQN